ncbi:exonuclease domain-containing protein [Paenibacillus sp. 1P07SE]|uniref:exonuclease domain-containing protein n=1 Tax=Paenibacillus sp. 1P07SE TaxID=3132209 RepID=UPI0039A63FCC
MDYIILDIEFNGRKFASELPMEVIEIGAVRLNSSLEQTGEFSALIKPVYFAKLNSFIKKKTGIPQADIDTASRFPKVIRAFMDWLQESDEPLLVTWGGEDMKRIVLDTRMHKLDDAYWLSVYYYDLLKGYLKCKQLTNDVSVEAAIQELGIPASGSAHRALDDARMTAEIFRSVFSQLDFEQRKQYKDVFSNAKERRIVKNAIRSMHAQKTVPTWELFVSHYGKDKPMLADPRKVAELQVYFAEEAAKPPKPVTRKPRPLPQEAADGAAETAGDEAGNTAGNGADDAANPAFPSPAAEQSD